MDNGPGTPIARLTYLLDELAKRFPGAVNPCLSDPPEPKYLAAIDRLIVLENYYRKTYNDWLSEYKD
jgi:hypothetical protein